MSFILNSLGASFPLGELFLFVSTSYTSLSVFVAHYRGVYNLDNIRHTLNDIEGNQGKNDQWRAHLLL